jgi:fibro-slime domain-containing protein
VAAAEWRAAAGSVLAASMGLSAACSAGGGSSSRIDQPMQPDDSALRGGSSSEPEPSPGLGGSLSISLGGVGPDGEGDSADTNSAETCDGKLTAVVRDFQPTHPDFEFAVPGDGNKCYCSEKGIVGSTLGDDHKPTYVGGQGRTTSSRAAFDQWYRDVPGVNQRAEIELQFEPTPAGTYIYDSAPPGAAGGTVATKQHPGFFPIDGMLFGNSGNDDWGQPHNYHFTLEIASAFVYEPGNVFRFRGDDDVWVYIDRKLVIDLGGIHVPETATVELDQLGLAPGETYSLHFFFAERHVTGSNFLMETNLRFVDCRPPK